MRAIGFATGRRSLRRSDDGHQVATRTTIRRTTLKSLTPGRGQDCDRLRRPASCATTTAPDLIAHGRLIHTMDDANPAAESLAVKDGRFMAVGSRADIEALRGAAHTQVLAARARDAARRPRRRRHHPPASRRRARHHLETDSQRTPTPQAPDLRELKDVNVDVRSVAEIKERMAARARARRPASGSAASSTTTPSSPKAGPSTGSTWTRPCRTTRR